MIGLEGKSAFVAGAASGIGLAIGSHLPSLGATVVLSDLPGAALDAAAASIAGARTAVPSRPRSPRPSASSADRGRGR